MTYLRSHSLNKSRKGARTELFFKQLLHRISALLHEVAIPKILEIPLPLNGIRK